MSAVQPSMTADVTPVITYDVTRSRATLLVRNVPTEWIEPFRPTPSRGGGWSLGPAKYGAVLYNLTQRAGLVDVIIRRRSVSNARARHMASHCAGSCPDATGLVCACRSCCGREHGALRRLWWSSPIVEYVTLPSQRGGTWSIKVERRQVAYPVGKA